MFEHHEHVIVGYGSLLSHDSRFRHSEIDCLPVPVSVKGYKRAWVTRSTGEKQTYVGAKACSQSQLNGVLLPIEEISPDLKVREQDYRFVAVEMTQIDMHISHHEENFAATLEGKQIWLCETLYQEHADSDHPVYQSYIDTCLIGCLETGLVSFAHEFIESTHLWEACWVNDREAPKYPRHAKISQSQQTEIDDILGQAGILHHRKSQD